MVLGSNSIGSGGIKFLKIPVEFQSLDARAVMMKWQTKRMLTYAEYFNVFENL